MLQSPVFICIAEITLLERLKNVHNEYKTSGEEIVKLAEGLPGVKMRALGPRALDSVPFNLKLSFLK